MVEKMLLDDAAWRERLTPEQYRVARGHGTEAPFAGDYWQEKRSGDWDFSIVCQIQAAQARVHQERFQRVEIVLRSDFRKPDSGSPFSFRRFEHHFPE